MKRNVASLRIVLVVLLIFYINALAMEIIPCNDKEHSQPYFRIIRPTAVCFKMIHLI